MVTRSKIAIILLQGCLMNAASIPSNSNLRAFHLWMENNYDSNIHKGQLKSPECEGKPDGIYGNPTDCSPNYTVCSGGNTLASMPCRNGEVFDEALGSCVAPEASLNCRNLATTTTVPTVSPVTIPPFTCVNREDGNYPISTCSANYYICISGEMFLTKCPAPGSVFDPETSVCKSNSTAPGCSGDVTTSTSMPPVTIPPFTCEDGRQDGPYPISVCSANYYLCVSGEMYFAKCPAPESVFDPETLNCKNSATCPRLPKKFHLHYLSFCIRYFFL